MGLFSWLFKPKPTPKEIFLKEVPKKLEQANVMLVWALGGRSNEWQSSTQTITHARTHADLC